MSRQRANALQMLGSLELRHLRYFVAASDHGSFRKASAALGMQESTISRAIRDLEDKLGASLFHRRVGGVCLTFAGERFLETARVVLQEIDLGIREVAAIGSGENGCIKVGISSSLASGFLSDLLGAYKKGHTQVRIEISDGRPAKHVTAVQKLRLDVAFVAANHQQEDCVTEPLWCERLFLLLPSGHRLADNAEINWLDIRRESYVISDIALGPVFRDILLQRFVEFKGEPDIQSQQVSWEKLASLVTFGHSVTLASEAATASQIPGVVYRPIVDEVLSFSAVWSPRNDNPALRRLLSMARVMSRRSGFAGCRASG